jgi:hypothetical protein
MAAVGDMIQVTAEGLWLGQLNQNVFFYRIEDAPTATWYDGVAEEFEDEVLLTVRNIQSPSFTWVRLVVRNLFNAGETYEYAVSVAGTRACDAGAAAEASFMAAGFKLVRANARVKHGYKYFGALCEGDVSGNLFTLVGATTDTVEAGLAAPLVAGGVDTFKPVIVGRIMTVVASPTTLNPNNLIRRYKLPVSQAAMADNWAYVREAVVNPYITTMRSRKAGHGH